MTNDLPEALIEKVARAIIRSHFMYPKEIEDLTWMTYSSMAEAALQALDLEGIISDLRFYEDAGNYINGEVREIGKFKLSDPSYIAMDEGQRARTRLLMLTGNGENDDRG